MSDNGPVDPNNSGAIFKVAAVAGIIGTVIALLTFFGYPGESDSVSDDSGTGINQTVLDDSVDPPSPDPPRPAPEQEWTSALIKENEAIDFDGGRIVSATDVSADLAHDEFTSLYPTNGATMYFPEQPTETVDVCLQAIDSSSPFGTLPGDSSQGMDVCIVTTDGTIGGFRISEITGANYDYYLQVKIWSPT